MRSRLIYKIICIVSFGLILLFTPSCGSKRNPTGGKEDLDKPIVLATLPEEFGEISDQKVEITFSKPIDRATFLKGIYIYPPVLNKKVYFESNVVTLKFLEALEAETNYFITLTTRIKDIRGNALDKNQTLTFRNGRLQDGRISGNISYEEQKDNGIPIQLNLLSADSLWVLTREIKGSSYAIDALNPVAHILRAYIDKNINGRYDFGTEPYFETLTKQQKTENLDLQMAYADTTQPVLKSVKAISNREFELNMNKPIQSFSQITIHSVDKKRHLPIVLSLHERDRITILTAESDTSKWVYSIVNAADAKGNSTQLSNVIINGTNKADKTAPTVTGCQPRSGTSVPSLQPLLEVTFSEIIPLVNMNATIMEADSKTQIPFKILKSNGKTYQFQPEKPLNNYRSCVLTIETETCDLAGNGLKEPFKLVFLPISRPTQAK